MVLKAQTSNSQTGFTIIELIVTLVIIGVIAATAAPRMMTKGTFDSRGFSDQLQSMIRYGQKIAVAQQRNVYVKLAQSSAALCYDTACSSHVAHPAGAGGTSGSCSVDSTWFCIAIPSTLTYSYTQAAFYFNALGQPLLNATTAMPNATVTINGDSTARQFTVEQETGYVRG